MLLYTSTHQLAEMQRRRSSLMAIQKHISTCWRFSHTASDSYHTASKLYRSFNDRQALNTKGCQSVRMCACTSFRLSTNLALGVCNSFLLLFAALFSLGCFAASLLLFFISQLVIILFSQSAPLSLAIRIFDFCLQQCSRLSQSVPCLAATWEPLRDFNSTCQSKSKKRTHKRVVYSEACQTCNSCQLSSCLRLLQWSNFLPFFCTTDWSALCKTSIRGLMCHKTTSKNLRPCTRMHHPNLPGQNSCQRTTIWHDHLH